MLIFFFLIFKTNVTHSPIFHLFDGFIHHIIFVRNLFISFFCLPYQIDSTCAYFLNFGIQMVLALKISGPFSRRSKWSNSIPSSSVEWLLVPSLLIAVKDCSVQSFPHSFRNSKVTTESLWLKDWARSTLKTAPFSIVNRDIETIWRRRFVIAYYWAVKHCTLSWLKIK